MSLQIKIFAIDDITRWMAYLYIYICIVRMRMYIYIFILHKKNLKSIKPFYSLPFRYIIYLQRVYIMLYLFHLLGDSPRSSRLGDVGVFNPIAASVVVEVFARINRIVHESNHVRGLTLLIRYLRNYIIVQLYNHSNYQE